MKFPEFIDAIDTVLAELRVGEHSPVGLRDGFEASFVRGAAIAEVVRNPDGKTAFMVLSGRMSEEPLQENMDEFGVQAFAAAIAQHLMASEVP